MAKNIYFGHPDDEICYNLNYFEQLMKDELIDRMILYKAIPVRDIEGYFWCSHHGESGDKSERTCGLGCERYSPRNGKNGCCRHYSTIFYEKSNEIIVLRLRIANEEIKQFISCPGCNEKIELKSNITCKCGTKVKEIKIISLK